MSASTLFYMHDSRDGGCIGSAVTLWQESGYNVGVDSARVFTQSEAEAQHKSRSSDIPLKKDMVDGLVERRVDVQRLRRVVTAQHDVGECLLRIGDSYDGNCVYWYAQGGNVINLDRAHRYPDHAHASAAAAQLEAEGVSSKVYFMSEIERVAYKVLPLAKLDESMYLDVKAATLKSCACCGKRNDVHEMKVCMHAQMHRYVCDNVCMNKFYDEMG